MNSNVQHYLNTKATDEGARSPNMRFEDFQLLSCELVLRQFGSDPEIGLSSQVAHDRLVKDGPNEVLAPKPRILLLFLGKFWGPHGLDS